MTSWKAGYVADVEYIPGFYPNHAPAYLDLVCLAGGIAPPERGADFAWCELGCGQGLTANLLAAAHPQARFHGIDFLGVHVAAARELAEAAGLTNIRFDEADFAEAAGDDRLGRFDYVVVHGVYSWVSRAAQEAVVRFLDRRLKPGGAALVSYNSVPGWAAMAPLQKLLLAHASASAGDSVARLRAGLDFARALQGAGAAALAGVDLNRIAGTLPGRSAAESDAYLAHEYLNVHWQPLLHADVAHDLAGIGLAYAGSARMHQNLPDLMLSDAQRAVLADIADPALRESFADYCGQPGFRSDVFVRDPRRLTPQEAEARLRAVLLGRAGGLALPYTLTFGDRTRTLSPETWEPIQAALAESVQPVGALLDLPALAGRDDVPSARDLALLLVGSEQFLPAMTPPPAVPESVRRFNHVQIARGLASDAAVVPLAAAIGGGVVLGRADALVFAARAETPPPDDAAIVERVQQALHGPALIVGGDPQAFREQAERRVATAQAVCDTLASQPAMLRRLGIA